jgi:hypothetical protein
VNPPGGALGAPGTLRRVGACVAVALAMLAIDPELYRLPPATLALIAAAGVAGYLARRRMFDGVLYLLAHLLCAARVETVAGPQLLACLTLGVLALSARPRFALFTGGSLFALLLFSMEMKQRHSGSILTWQDVRYFFVEFGDNVGVMASQPTVVAYSVALLVGVAAGCALAWRLDGHPALATSRFTARGPLLARALSVLLVVWSAVSLNDASAAQSAKDSWILAEKTIATPISTFLSTLHLEPKLAYRRIDTAFFAAEVQAVRARQGRPLPRADLVVFLQESQINPAAIASCPASLCRLDAFGTPDGTVNHGELQVHTFGAGTWLAEFELATGIPHRLYGAAGNFAPFNVAPGINRSFVRSLKAAGYHTVALYPVRGGMMNARNAYASYGFDEFHDARDLGLGGGFATPDSKMHDAAVRALQSARRHGKPVYLMVVTVFNHGEHGINLERVPPDVAAAARKTFKADGDAETLADYLWRTHEFEAALRKTRAAVLGEGRPAVLAWFGDHQPTFANAPELRKRLPGDHYLTWYNISSNQPGAGSDTAARRLDIVFLAGLLAQRAGVPLDDWLAANVAARERCGGLLFECRDAQWRDGYFSYVLGDLRSIR